MSYKTDNRFSILLGERRQRITDVSQATGLSRTTLTSLYHGREKGIQYSTLEALCAYFHCGIGDLLVLREGGSADAGD